MKVRYLVGAIQLAIFSGFSGQAAAFSAEQTDSKIEKIIVTGQKIDRTIQETATSVVVVTKKQMEEQNIETFYNVIERSANVSGSLEEGGFSIRGIDAFNVSGGGNSYLASVYVDGAALPRRMIQEGGFSTWDVSQVELLRGPQSTLQGRNALAGAVVMKTERPAYEPEAKLRLTVGEQGKQGIAFAGGDELVSNEVAFRFSAEKASEDGTNYNITRQEDSYPQENETYRLKFLYEPESLPGFSAQLGYTYSETFQGSPATSTISTETIKNRYDIDDVATELTTENHLYNLELEYEINDYWYLNAVTSYTLSNYSYQWDGDGTAEPIGKLNGDRDDDTLSQEVRFVYQDDSISAVVGAYFSDLQVDDQSSGERSSSLKQLGVPKLLVAPAEFGGLGLPESYASHILSFYEGFDPAVLNVQGESDNIVSNVALFADATVRLTEQWDLIAGLRFDRERQEVEGHTNVVVSNKDKLPTPSELNVDPTTKQILTGLNAQLFAMAAAASQQEPLAKETFNAFLPKLGVSYHWNDDITTSFIVQKGYRSGGVGTNTAKSTRYTYDPEYTWNYEASFRSVWLDGSLSANANVFYLDWKDQQVNVQLGTNRFDSETKNAGSSTVKGFDTELFYQFNDELRISAGVGYAKTEFEEFVVTLPTATFDLSGRSFAGAPTWTGNLGLTYQNAEGWFSNINVNHSSDSNTINNPWTGNVPETDKRFDAQTPAVTLVNARAGYQWDNYQVHLTATNLLDKEFLTYPDTGYDSQTYGKERQVSLQLQAQF
ncbi:TonB-dependent receptor [Psychrobium sp. 1_MG-2023]|uniref:TonB-dependent receptor n=1 Tax=Psychrobium sp. 1_MG-2023 TaxID=3062624 RepID=UPI000C3431D2|nr:TonB-dependent receptor [Psychrobium sp. 1_MG-2023]MDP2560641.1 TonB-dependent receptor [Psychrobium sp. 1_MG-2023]PKF56539.1 hypothetical protein CW748_08620 [Alteromonadales bacterium alter-6D02]